MTSFVKDADDFQACMKKADEHGKGLDYINQRIGCPARYASATPDTMDEKLKRWFDETGGCCSVLIHGTVGTGKTHSTLALAKLLFINKVYSQFYNVIEFLDSLKAQYNFDDCDIKSALTVDHTLILDDFGAEKSTDWTQEIIYRLVNLRYEMMLKTIFISNLSPKEMGKVYGDRIVSRIIEMSKYSIIKIDGKDRRLK